MKQQLTVFLRGVNVIGIRIKMNTLVTAFEHMGYQDVKTILASGNVVITTEEDGLIKEAHKEKVEMGLSSYFAYEAYVSIKDIE